jgi:hypothetical protein
MPGFPAAVRVAAGDAQRAAVGTVREVAVVVADVSGNAVADHAVTAFPSHGTVEDSTRTTDAAGRAVFRWTLGRAAGRQQVAFKAQGVDSMARAAAIAIPRAVANVVLQAAAGVPAAGKVLAVTASVTDDYGNAIAGVQVMFSGSAGNVAPTRVATDARGQAVTRWTPAARAGEQVLTATVRGTSVKGTHTVSVIVPTRR